MKRDNIISALDIGTHKVSCLIARINANNDINVLGYGAQAANGFKLGSISNLREAENSVSAAVESAEIIAKRKIEKLTIGLSCDKIESLLISNSINIGSERVIDNKIVNKAISSCINLYDSKNQEILHHFPLGYYIDEQEMVKDPIAMYGKELGCDLHLVTTPSNTLMNIANCVARCHLDTENFISSAYAAAIACLNYDEQELGSLLIDIGGTRTNFVIYYQHTPIYIGSVPIGSTHITSDIAQCCALNIPRAEKIKMLYGRATYDAYDNNKIVDYGNLFDNDNQDIESTPIRLSDLTDIIKARVEEIFERIRDTLIAEGMKYNIPKRVVLTGGGSQLTGIKEAANQIFPGQIRLSLPHNVVGLPSEYRGPSFSSTIGMLQIMRDNIIFRGTSTKNDNNSSFIHNFFAKIFN